MSVYCACGAEWHGRWVKRAEAVIAEHKERWAHQVMGCGPITKEQWESRFKRRSLYGAKRIACPECGHVFERADGQWVSHERA